MTIKFILFILKLLNFNLIAMIYEFGEKIRYIREKKGITMKELAHKIGVTESLISQIERNKVSPAIETLLKILDVLEVDIEYIFSDYKKEKIVKLVKKNEREKIIRKDVIYERLSQIKEDEKKDGIEAYYIEILPGGMSGSSEYGHKGKELGIIIEGTGEFFIGGKNYILQEGDSISFSSDVPHFIKNIGNNTLKAYWIITPPKMFLS